MTPGELRRRVRAGWGLGRIGLHERFEERTARRATAPARRLAIARARRRVAPLRRWEGIPERTFERHARGGNAVRIARVRDLVPPGCRVLDVGMGHGYVAGVLLRDRAPARYCGIELRESRIDAAREMIAANGLDGSALELVAADVLELDPGFWRERDPDLVLLLEVLEHLGDPGRLLRAVAAARPGARVLFTVPLDGRLEWVWGHRSLFGRRRLERLCREAGLVIERAEPVQSTWALVLARVEGDPAPSTSRPDPLHTFARVAAAPADRPGALELPVSAPRVVRLELELDPAAARTLRIRGLDADGRPRLEWAGGAIAAGRATYVLRPGRRAGPLAPVGRAEPGAVRSIEVAIEAPAGGRRRALAIRRAAYAGGAGGPGVENPPTRGEAENPSQ